ncbi:Non-catalytic module family DOC2 [Piromyces sp. E2]|nr:Non-catalytic module family DOC2 [Piromyces sp. E2]|eukprot:OUM66023.1 Non-catalytic module family DOC2 [Piromyces sp. E2]
MAVDYLTGGWDHLIHNGHNYYMYKSPKGKWTYLSYDFDLELGQNIDHIFLYYITEDIPDRIKKIDRDYQSYSYAKWVKVPLHIIDILIMKDSTRFDRILKNIVEKVFNPGTLYPHIDEIKQFIKPFVELDKTPDANGHYPGRINVLANDMFSLEEWDANSEFTTISTYPYCAFGIKYWILAKYRYICKAYALECDATYIDENYDYPIDKNVEFQGYFTSSSPSPSTTITIDETVVTTSTISSSSSSSSSSTITTTNVLYPTDTIKKIKCKSEIINYPCCSPELTTIYAHDEYGDWSYDFDKKEWCGLSPYEEDHTNDDDEECWSKVLGYSCC